MILLALCIGILLLFNAYDFFLLLKPEWRRDDRSSAVAEALKLDELSSSEPFGPRGGPQDITGPH